MSNRQTVTMDDIAKLAKVSKPTVSRALSDSPLVKAETKAHVLAVAEKHGYAVNRNAQKLRHGRTNTIAVVLDYPSHRKNRISDPFIFELLAGVSEALAIRNQDLLLCSPQVKDISSFKHLISSKGADGIIFIGQGRREQLLNELSLSSTPFVVWGARSINTPYCVVGSDNFMGGWLAGNYFLSKNRRHFLFVGDTTFSEIYWRKEGLKKAAAESKTAVDISDVVVSMFSFHSVYEAACEFLEHTTNPPDAIFAFSDTAAMAFIHAFRGQGLECPRDFSVVGYNDISVASHFHPPITTVHQDIHQACELLVEKLITILDDAQPESAVLKTELIIRTT